MLFNFYFVDPATINGSLLIELHDYVMFYIVVIFVFFIYLFCVLVYRYRTGVRFMFDFVLFFICFLFVFFYIWFFFFYYVILCFFRFFFRFFSFIFVFFFRLFPSFFLYFFFNYYPFIILNYKRFVDYSSHLGFVLRSYVSCFLFDFCCFVFFFFELIDDLVFVLFIFLFRLIEVFNYCVDFVCEFILYYFEREIKFFYFSYIGFAFELNVDVISRVYDLFPFLFNYTDRFVCTRYFSLVEFFTCDLLPFFFPTFPWFWGFLSSFNRSLIVQISTYHDLYLNRLSYIFFDQPFYFEFCKQAWTNLSLDLEIVWTIVPTLILVFIAIPSFWVLFCVDELLDPLVTVKCIGNQWYWSYEYDHYGIRFDSYMLPLEDQFRGGLRLLEVDNYLVLPINVSQRILVTSTDVIHSWAVPAFGIKVDGVPGRLNQVSFYGTRCGLFFGQCSELCGVNHGFMPIAVRLVSVNEFIDYVRLRGYDLLSL